MRTCSDRTCATCDLPITDLHCIAQLTERRVEGLLNAPSGCAPAIRRTTAGSGADRDVCRLRCQGSEADGADEEWGGWAVNRGPGSTLPPARSRVLWVFREGQKFLTPTTKQG